MILIDTTPLVALCDARDEKHRTAVKHLESLASSEFAVCDPVLTEAAFHLPDLGQRQRLRALLEALGVQPVPAVNESAFRLEVFEWLVKYADHQPDWADGCLAVLSGRDRDAKVWTYDREFRTIWRRPNGTAIPMAVRFTWRAGVSDARLQQRG
jgi:predicted nucleic acid-binding protein